MLKIPSGFKRYVLTRRDIFESKYQLNGVPLEEQPYRDTILPNNLRYLDDSSQYLIRKLNRDDIKLEDKLITCFVYSILPEKTYLISSQNNKGIYDLECVEKLAQKLDTYEEKILPYLRYVTIASCVKEKAISHGDGLRLAVASFLDNMPRDKFVGYKQSELLAQMTKYDPVFGLGETPLNQLIHSLSYIDELQIKLDFINKVPEYIQPNVKLILGITAKKRYDYTPFTEEVMDWYAGQKFLHPCETFITPNDVLQMVIGYGIVKCHMQGYFHRKHKINYSADIRDIKLTESIKRYYGL